jgi:glycosyltransferase involved in cell wall biosynthesis
MDLSVIIPTSGRRRRLVRTLRSLQGQLLDGIEAEVVVVENGPASASGEIDREAATGRLPVRLIQLDAAGTSRARNRALRECRGEIALFIGDDTRAAAPDLLASHVSLHRASPSERYAVLGRVQWDPDGHVTEFMRWLDRAGFQFSFELLRSGPVSASRYMYTSHTSAKTSLLRRHAGFDESFEFLLEDVELGIRLERDGVVLDYHPELVVLHDHPQGLADVLQRMERVGRAARLLHRKLPDEAPPEVTAPRRHWALLPPADLIARAALAAGAGGRVRERLWTVRLLAAYARGYRADGGDGAGARLAAQDPEAVTPEPEPVQNRP